MLLLLDGTPGSDITLFLTRLHEETLSCTILLYAEWLQQHDNCENHDHTHPDGIIFMRVNPEIAHKRLQRNTSELLVLEDIQHIYAQKEEFFIANKNNPTAIKNLPVLVLNGNIDFQTDFSQFYNHLFYIRRFLKEIQERKDIAMGIHKEKAPQRKCC